jgi:phosphatidylserine/phosphatidylglycerophosphate/cardiolipin synthase-like enzyme
MTDQPRDLSSVASATLERLREAIATGALAPPLDRASLIGFGIRNQLDALECVLSGHRGPACLAVLDVALAERAARRPAPELVWTGPEGASATARDTAVVLRALFEGAREHVVLAGYTFSQARDVLAPLHHVMQRHDVAATFFVHIPQTEEPLSDPAAYVAHHLGAFAETNWPFGAPYPKIYYDKRALAPGPPFCSLHAKCVAIDGLRAFVSSANFTQRGQDRNIEVGVLIEDPVFASHLENQWLSLLESRVVLQASWTASRG